MGTGRRRSRSPAPARRRRRAAAANLIGAATSESAHSARSDPIPDPSAGPVLGGQGHHARAHMVAAGALAVGAYAAHAPLGRFARVALFGVDQFTVDIDAFSAFTTLVGMLASILLGQMFQYYFDRQGAIQDAVFHECAALHGLHAIVCMSLRGRQACLGKHNRDDADAASSTSDCAVQARRAYDALTAHVNRMLLGMGGGVGSGSGSVDSDSTGPDAPTRALWAHELSHVRQVVDAIRVLDSAAGSSPETVSLTASALASVRQIERAAGTRISQVNADLPPAQWYTMSALSTLLLGAFLLLDFGPKLGPLLFGTVAAAAGVFAIVLSDLSNPFGGLWSVEPAQSSVTALLSALESCEYLHMGECRRLGT